MTRHVSLVVAAIASVVLVATFTSAQNESIENAVNPFEGKTVIFQSTAAYLTNSPKQGVRLETVAGREFFAWQQKGEETHDYWIAADSITKIRIFEKLEDAEAFAQRRDPRPTDGTKR